MAFSPAYQEIYNAALARQRAIEARQRGLATRSASRAGVSSSGVALIPQQDITREATRAEQQIGAQVAGQQEGERLQDKEFAQRKELMSFGATLQEAADARRLAIEKANRKAGITGQIIGAGVGALGSYLGRNQGDNYYG